VKILFIGLYTAISSLLTRLRREEGQTMAEYGILIGVIAIIVVAAAFLLGGSITNLFNNAGSHL
jgi:pilus assembly protein Flp/PilA